MRADTVAFPLAAQCIYTQLQRCQKSGGGWTQRGMSVYLLPTVQRGREACVAVPTAVYIHGEAYTTMYGDSSLGHL